jgi:alkaline phosphatase
MKKNYIYRIFLIVFTITFSSFVFGQEEINSPKNIIFLIGDGMGYNVVTATNYFIDGEDSTAPYQEFPVVLGVSTYNGVPGQEYRSDSAWLDYNWVRRPGKFTDSAPAATALSTGKKSYDGAIGVSMDSVNLTHFMQFAKTINKATGVVTTVQISHATPAGHIAHNINRNNYAEIANEMFNSDIDVIIGAGHPDYNDNSQPRTDKQYKYVGGEETWNNLISGNLHNWTFSDDSTRIAEIANGINVPTRFCAISKVASTLQQSRDLVDPATGDEEVLPFVAPFNNGVNTLPQLALAALNVLNKNNNGFVVMIEGGAIDWACHANQKGRMIEEQHDFNNTVEAVIDWVEANGGWENNLVVVTADHETGYLLGELPNDNKFTTNPVINNSKNNMPGMKFWSGDHTNMLVPVYAKGAGSEMLELYADRVDALRGKYIDNTEIAKTFFTLWDHSPVNVDAVKNVIFMISDGWGENQIKATNYYMGETQEYETFPVATYMSTYHGMGTKGSTEISDYYTSYNSEKAWTDPEYINIDPTDSAPAATAMGTGFKAYDGSINYSTSLLPLETLAEIALRKGKKAGAISTVQFSHATPAAFGASHNESRNNYAEIANEMLSGGLSVIMGAGHPDYDNNGQLRSNKEYKYVGGEATWNSLVNNQLNDWNFSDEKSRLEEVADGYNVPDKFVFVAQVAETLQQSRDGDDQSVNFNDFNTNVPNLVDMTKASLNILNKDNDKGFFIMIEGGAIDWACHANQKGRLIEEQNDFNKSVDAVIEWVEANSNWDETLLIVTGDHETGYLGGVESMDLLNSTVIDNGVNVMPTMKFYSGNHTNQLIPFYAKGAIAENLNDFANNYDLVRKYYIENTETANQIKIAWRQISDELGIADNDNSDNTRLLDKNNNLSLIINSNNTITGITDLMDGDAKVLVININGQILSKTNCTIENSQFTINTPNVNGIFFVNVTSNNRSASAKAIILK